MIASLSEPFGLHHFSTMAIWSLRMTRKPMSHRNTTTDDERDREPNRDLDDEHGLPLR